MTPAKVIARLRRLAEDWRHEERRLCEQFGGAVAPQSMRARQIKDTQAIDAAIETVDRLEAAEKERDELRDKIEAMEKQEPVAWARKLGLDVPSFGCVTDLKYRPSDIPESSYIPLYTNPCAQPAPNFADAYQGAMEEVAIWKRRALEAETLNRKFIAEINGPMHMGEPAQPAPSVPGGWKLVPTAESRHPGIYKMLGALHVVENTPGASEWESYAAMLAAAPEAKP